MKIAKKPPMTREQEAKHLAVYLRDYVGLPVNQIPGVVLSHYWRFGKARIDALVQEALAVSPAKSTA